LLEANDCFLPLLFLEVHRSKGPERVASLHWVITTREDIECAQKMALGARNILLPIARFSLQIDICKVMVGQSQEKITSRCRFLLFEQPDCLLVVMDSLLVKFASCIYLIAEDES